MVAQYINVKKFRDFLGVDLKSTDIKRGPQFASGGQNVDFTIKNSINKRRGYQYKASNGLNAGLAVYAKVDVTGIPAPELISIGAGLKKLTIDTLELVYSGFVEARVKFSLVSSSSTFVLTLFEDNIEKLSFDCGDGVTSIVSIADLMTAINALGSFSVSTTGDTSQPAAFLGITRDTTLVIGTPFSIELEYFADVNNGSITMGANISEQGKASFENPAFVNLNNVLYITNRIDGLFKYDGQTFYRAGMPIGVTPTLALGGGGPLTGSYIYAATYIQIDAQGQVIEGNISPDSAAIVPAAQSVNVTLTNILVASGFNTNGALANGAQSTVNTITVDDGSGGEHSLQIGDTAYFFDGVTSLYVTREITARSTTTITVAGDPVTVADNAVISNNLRIAIYRTVASGVAKFFIAEVPNDSYNTTQVYSDTTTDLLVGATFIAPKFRHDEPPKIQYLTTYRNLLIGAGSEADSSRIYWSDSDGPEYFPLSSHAIDINTKIGDVVTGLGVNNDQLVMFKEQSIFVGAGDFANLNFVVDQLTSGDLGCVAHGSIQEVREGVLYFLTSRGPYQLIGGQLPTPVGPTVGESGNQFSRIESFFTDLTQDADVLPKLKRSIAINWTEQAKYVLFIPSEDGDGTSAANANSVIWVFDYSRGAWLPNWTNINASGGLAFFDDKVYWTARTTANLTARFLNTDDELDFADHTIAVDFVYEDSWEHLGEPNIKKKFLRLVMMVLDDIESASWNLTVDQGVDFQNNLTLASLTVPFGDSESLGWGNSPWGEFAWGEPLNISKKLKLKHNATKAMRIIFKNNELHKNILLTGWEIQVAAPYKEVR